MAGYEKINDVLRRAGRRRRWQRAWRGLWHGLLIGGGLWLLVLGLFKVLPLPMGPTLGWGGVVAALAPLLGFIHGWSRPEGPLATARWLDLAKGFKERVSTAVELEKTTERGPWAELVVADAAQRLDNVNVRALLPFHVPRIWKSVLLVLVLGAGLGFVPEYRSEAHLQQQREKAVVEEAGQRLAEIARRTLDKRTPELDSTRKSLESIEELGKELARRPLTRDEALRDLAKLTEQVDQDLQDLARKPGVRSLQKTARSGSSDSPASANELQKRLDALQKQMNGKSPEPDALEKLAENLRKAQKAASAMGQNSDGMEAAKAELAKSLAEMAQQAANLGAAVPNLEEALEALQAGQIDQMLKNMDLASQDLQQALNMAKAIQQMQQQQAAMGKNLKEQLERGQAAAAAARLREMARKLQSGQSTPEQMQQMMQELSDALDPAGEYGEVKGLLEQGLQQMKAGQQAAASQSMKDAAKMLEDMLQQMADAQSLQSAMAALQKAQMCVGNCPGWGMCQGPGRPGFKPGGQPGRGVGTWADDSQMMNPQNTGLWDNSGVQRPDLDPRGLTERETDLSEDLSPTRLKGQFNPGGPMPSITLKGVSIKGQSRVALQEAMATAQSEAQAALTEEVIPRAYQGAVRDYFDDFKE
jgi:hypothetical protein